MSWTYEEANRIVQARIDAGEPGIDYRAGLDPIKFLEEEAYNRAVDKEAEERFTPSVATPPAVYTPIVNPAAPFPVDALPPAMRRMVKAVAGNKQVPADLPALFGIGVVSTVAAPHLEIARGAGWTEPLNLYISVVMDSGTGKTPAEKDVVRPLFAIEKRIRADHAETIDSQIDELDLQRGEVGRDVNKANRVEAQIKDLEDRKKRQPNIITGSDVTMEALVREMEYQNGSAAIIDSEGEFFSLMSGRYSGGTPNLGIALKAYDADRYRVSRIGRDGADVERAVLTLALGVQPIVMEEAAKSAAMVERGLLNRFLFGWPESLLGTRDDEGEPYDRDAMQGWADLVERLHAVVQALEPDEDGTLPLLVLSPRARARHVEFCGWIERRLHPDDGDLGTLPGWAAKHKARALRLAGILHLGGDQPVDVAVSEQTMNAAIVISKWAVGLAIRVFSAGGSGIEVEDQRCLDVIAWVRKAKPTQFSIRDVRRGCRRKWLSEGGVAELVPVLDRLVDDGALFADEGRDKQGHRQVLYRPNPALLEEVA